MQPINDGGEREVFEGGGVREPATGKGRYDLISPFALARVLKIDVLDPHAIFEPFKTCSMALDEVFYQINEFRRGERKIDRLALAARASLNALHLDDKPGPSTQYNWYEGVISPYALDRIAKWYEAGARKYSDRNWEKGTSYSRCLDSAIRHMNKYRMGMRDEDHLAALVWNLFAYIHYEELGMTQFDDVPKYEKKEIETITLYPRDPDIKPICISVKEKNCILSDREPMLSVHKPYTREELETINKELEEKFKNSPIADTAPFARMQKKEMRKRSERDMLDPSRRGYTIYAVDFDGSLCSNRWPKIGNPNHALFNFILDRRIKGDKFILWTCRSGKQLDDAVAWCKERGITFDAVNKNIPEIEEVFGPGGPKVFADEYLDDKAQWVSYCE